MALIRRLNRQSKRLNLVLDTNVILGILKHNGPLHRILRKFSGISPRILISKLVLHELHQIAGYSEEEVISAVSSKLEGKVTIIGKNEDISQAAEELESKYTCAHYPDSELLATALISDSTLLTYDRGLIKCAKSEGVRTFSPKQAEAN